jgi:two-component system, LytTR family, response regulator LytT
MRLKFNILIVEDELLIAEMLKEMLTDLGHSVIATARNFVEAIQKLNQFPSINFAVLDINLGQGKTGIDVAREIRSNHSIPFIFLTSYSDKKSIQEAIQCKPEAYLIKPFSLPDLMATLELIKVRTPSANSFTFKSGYQTLKINTSDILWLKSENVYVELSANGKTHLLRSSLDKILQELNDENIIRVHRSHAVNLLHVEAVNSHHIMIGNKKIPLSRKFYNSFIEKYNS